MTHFTAPIGLKLEEIEMCRVHEMIVFYRSKLGCMEVLAEIYAYRILRHDGNNFTDILIMCLQLQN